MSWNILARHKWVAGASITESVNNDDWMHRYTAPVRGFRNWRIFEGTVSPGVPELVIQFDRAVRDQIDAEGENCKAFEIVNKYSHDIAELKRRVEMFKHPRAT